MQRCQPFFKYDKVTEPINNINYELPKYNDVKAKLSTATQLYHQSRSQGLSSSPPEGGRKRHPGVVVPREGLCREDEVCNIT